MKTSPLLLAGARIDPASQFALSNFDKLPDSAFIRVPVLTGLGLGSPATIWRKVKQENLPAPVKLSKQCAAWQVGVIRRHIAELVEKGGAESKVEEQCLPSPVKEQRPATPVKLSKQRAASQGSVTRRQIAELVEKGGAE